MNGAAALVDGAFRPVRLTKRFCDARGHVFLTPLTAHVSARAHIVAAGFGSTPGGGHLTPRPTLGLDLVAAGSRNQDGREIRQLPGQGPNNWATLYKVYEIVQDQPGHKRWASERQYSAFSASANSPTISGADVRHSSRRFKETPKCTMTIDEAKAFIGKVLLAFVRSSALLQPLAPGRSPRQP